MSWKKFKDAFEKSTKLFHQHITPNLPDEIQDELKSCSTFSYWWENKQVFMNVNGKIFDITKWYVPNLTIFDVYEHQEELKV